MQRKVKSQNANHIFPFFRRGEDEESSLSREGEYSRGVIFGSLQAVRVAAPGPTHVPSTLPRLCLHQESLHHQLCKSLLKSRRCSATKKSQFRKNGAHAGRIFSLRQSLAQAHVAPFTLFHRSLPIRRFSLLTLLLF